MSVMGMAPVTLLGAAAALAPVAAAAMSTQTAEIDAVLRLKPRVDRGAVTFETCAACHGEDGVGASDGSVPAIAGQPVPVLVKQIVEFRYEARFSMRMRHFVDRHHLATAQEVADVVAYVSSLPPRRPAERPRSPRAARGAALFANLCASCHGPRADGDPASRVPRLAAQHPQYLSEQLHEAAEGRRPSMAADHARLLSRLSADDLDAIAEYLSGITPEGPGADATRPGLR